MHLLPNVLNLNTRRLCKRLCFPLLMVILYTLCKSAFCGSHGSQLGYKTNVSLYLCVILREGGRERTWP
ncbi:hypothetical protein Hanom_Chr08g00732391 [Helianthus anomalus]